MPYDHTLRKLSHSRKAEMIYKQFVNDCNTKAGLKFIIGGCAHRELGVHDVSEAAFQLLSKNYPNLLDLQHESVKQIYATHNQIVYEHIIPVCVIYQILRDIHDNKTMTIKKVQDVLNHVKYAVITKDEDNILTSSGLRAKMPDSWVFNNSSDFFARYNHVGIKMHEWKSVSKSLEF